MQESIKRIERNGMRYYQVCNDAGIIGEFPSITTVLSGTGDKSGLVKWKEKIGEEEALRISELSMNRGTVMHRLIELYKKLQGNKLDRLEELISIAREDTEVNQYTGHKNAKIWVNEGWQMFMKFYMNSSQYFDRVARVLESETFLWSVKGGGYAGTVDNISEMVDGKILVIDYKNSRKPKREDWIQDYFIQGSAYYVAYWERTGIKPDGVEIWISNEVDGIPQTFCLSSEDIKFYFLEFQKRLKKFKELYP